MGFKEHILNPIIKNCGLSNSNILLLPGNHDAQRNVIESIKDSHFKDLRDNNSEWDFNNYISEHHDSFANIFSNFRQTTIEYTSSQWENLGFLGFDIDNDWSVACLNTALCTFAHINNLHDEGNLSIATRPLYEWLDTKVGRHKILLMHHPIDVLSFWAAEELKGLIRTKFDIVITGHTHNQDLTKPLSSVREVIDCQLPHLFHDKSERAMGYCILDFNVKSEMDQIQYREWNPRKLKFVPGTSFTEEENGIVLIKTNSVAPKLTNDRILAKLTIDFNESMKVYEDMPSIDWENRFVSLKRVDQNLSFNENELYDETYIINEDDNFVLLSPRDYGLTCYGRHFALKLWKEYGLFSIFIENPNLKIPQIGNRINALLDEYGTSKTDVAWIIIDEWILPQKQRKEIIDYFQKQFPNTKLLLLSPRLEKYFTDNDEVSMDDGFKYLYLTPLTRHQMRSIANTFNKTKFIAEEDILIKRLDDDIRTFNMHRSPMNCITLLYVFKSSFEENPVNRTEVLEKVLGLIFDNDETPTYSTIPDQKDCRFALGKLCEHLLRNESNDYTFTKEEFIANINNISKEQWIDVEGNYLYDLLWRNHILLPYDGRIRFRSSYWVYFFGAIQMQNDPKFADYILSDEKYLHFPMILEFYSGLNRRQEIAASVILSNLNKTITEVRNNVGIPDQWNLYKLLKIETSDAQKQRLLNNLETEICGSNLPTEVKDSIADKDYDQRRPFDQDVYKLLEDYAVNKLMNYIPIASRVLRNSDYVNPQIKHNLFMCIINAWRTLLDTLAMLTPVLAIKGHVTYGGASFTFVDDISKYPLEQRMLIVLGSLPSNIIRWFEGDLYSNRNAPMYYEYLENNYEQLSKFLVASLILRQLPDKWEIRIPKFVKSLSENSYYLAGLVNAMRFTYSNKVISNEDAHRLKLLLKESIGRIRTRQSFVSPKLLNRIVSSDDIPDRKEVDE